MEWRGAFTCVSARSGAVVKFHDDFIVVVAVLDIDQSLFELERLDREELCELLEQMVAANTLDAAVPSICLQVILLVGRITGISLVVSVDPAQTIIQLFVVEGRETNSAAFLQGDSHAGINHLKASLRSRIECNAGAELAKGTGLLIDGDVDVAALEAGGHDEADDAAANDGDVQAAVFL